MLSLRKIFIPILFTTLSFSTSIHVATTGSDDTGDGSENNPYATIQKGIDMSLDGDTVLVGPGEYQETVGINKQVFLVSQNGPNETIIDGSCGYDRCNAITSWESDISLNVEGFTITGGTAFSHYDEGWVGGGIGPNFNSWEVDSIRLNQMIFI